MCVFCKGKLKQDTTEYVESTSNHVVLIRSVPCEKCNQCGETYFDNDTVLELESILNKIQHISGEITLTVIEYINGAA